MGEAGFPPSRRVRWLAEKRRSVFVRAVRALPVLLEHKCLPGAGVRGVPALGGVGVTVLDLMSLEIFSILNDSTVL